jgi:hypothetical protein
MLGCSRSKPPSQEAAADLQKWVPVGTPLASAQVIMEQKQFTCSVGASYDNESAIANDLKAKLWARDYAQAHGGSETVTNITILDCRRTVRGEDMIRSAEWLTINGKTYQLLEWTFYPVHK